MDTATTIGFGLFVFVIAVVFAPFWIACAGLWWSLVRRAFREYWGWR